MQFHLMDKAHLKATEKLNSLCEITSEGDETAINVRPSPNN